MIALGERRGKAQNDSELLRRARGRYALLLNEDSELQPGATLALHDALRGAPAGRLRRRAGCCAPTGAEQPSAWRFPTPLTALAGALFLHRLLTVQSRGARTREVDWCQSAALLVRREAAAQVGYLDPDFFVYSDEVDFARRLRDAGWRSVYVPAAVAIHHEQLSTGAVPRAADRRDGAQPRPLHAQAPLAPGGAHRALADRLGLRAARAPPRSCCPATTPAATGGTCARRCGRRGARACARPRTRTTARPPLSAGSWL